MALPPAEERTRRWLFTGARKPELCCAPHSCCERPSALRLQMLVLQGWTVRRLAAGVQATESITSATPAQWAGAGCSQEATHLSV